jgi:hypothetical protein
MSIKRRARDAGRDTQYPPFGEVSPSAGAIRNGSAIILAIVLTTLLAMIGVLFLLSSRVDSVATSAVGDNQDLKLAVDTVVAQISEVLTRDVPGVDPNGTYYDYPDGNNPWLACLEPYQFGTDYFWRQVSNIYGPAVQIVQAQILPEYQPTVGSGLLADADGDGVGDSIWVQVPGKASSKGKTIYAAIRIIDNGGMLNINTAYKFNPNSSVGSTQLDINLMALSWRPNNPSFPYNPAAESILLLARNPSNLPNYENNVIWQYGLPNGVYTPFDISDELELRYRYLINQPSVDARFEVMKIWQIGRQFDFRTPINSASDLDEWFISSNSDYALTDPNYAYRHIATTYNCDRIIDPAGRKMTNINTASQNEILDALRTGLSEAIPGDINGLAAQITANLMDYRDDDSNVTVVDINTSSGMAHYYGFETPCIYISEIAETIIHYSTPNDFNASSFAIELYKPYFTDPFPSKDPCNGWQLAITDRSFNISYIPIGWSGSQRFHIIASIDNRAPIDINNFDVNGPNEPNNPIAQNEYVAFSGGESIELQRYVSEAHTFITVDFVWVPEPNTSTGWLQPIDVNDKLSQRVYSYQRDTGGLSANPNKLIRGKPVAPGVGLWSGDFGYFPTPTIGTLNPWVSPEPYTSPYLIQAHPANKPFTNVGEIGQLFRNITSAYLITRAYLEPDVRLNIADTNVQSIFKYLTVMDPRDHSPIDPNETRIKGRVNINTAPWFVLAQLPWVSYHTQPNYNLARAIVAYRDKTIGPDGTNYSILRSGPPGFRNIGELMDVNLAANNLDRIDYYAQQAGSVFPALTPPDGTTDLFELRDAIFTRISNLITVRSDVFTAYILVRIGTDGPQKRVIAIFDRSEVPKKPVKIIAIQPVPDPR